LRAAVAALRGFRAVVLTLVLAFVVVLALLVFAIFAIFAVLAIVSFSSFPVHKRLVLPERIMALDESMLFWRWLTKG
jgi:hypothetical protein